MGDIWQANRDRWGDDVALLAVNEAGAEDGLHYIWEEDADNSLPVLQDITEVKAMWTCGASAYYFYVVDGDRNVAFAHYRLTIEDTEGEQLRAIEEIDEVLGGAR
jgi:hypothetical protein